MKPYLSALLVVGLAMHLAAADPAGYAHPERLVEPAELAKPAVAKDYIILDVRTKKKFDADRIPQARWVDHGAWVKAFGVGSDVEGWSKRIGALGVTPTSRVVLYDDTGVKDAAQIWWILRYWGVEDARLLNGGWTSWKAGGFPIETAEPKPIAATAATFKPNPQRQSTRDQVLDIVKGKTAQLLDARTPGEFTGSEKLAKRGGAIPGARHLEWTDLIDQKTQRFKPAAELVKLHQEAGIDPQKPVTAYCQTGRRSSVSVFALELIGAKEARNYFGSWFEWGNRDDTPVEPGKLK